MPTRTSSFPGLLRKLRALIASYDQAGTAGKRDILQRLSRCDLPATRALVDYADLLQFIQAFPPDPATLKAAEKELVRITRHLSGPKVRTTKALVNSGLPHTPYVSKFSHDACAYLLTDPDGKATIDRYEDPSFDLNTVLANTLPSLERSETTAGLENNELLAALGVRKGQELPFVVRELKRLDDTPRLKDLLFDGTGIYTRITPRDARFSRSFNRLAEATTFFHEGILKAFDHRELLDRPLNAPVILRGTSKEQLIRTVKRSMLVTERETDPTTYMDANSLRYHELERGLSVAIYGMVPQRQLPMESYIGYTLFKNGFPAAYGGAWVFGRRADFGINIFEAFRGGESGFMLCQLLRVFRQTFGAERFEIEPYQFGLDNPDGIKTGAFWFYHRYGFRPVDKALLALSEKEVQWRRTRKDHRTSERVLIRFTESNMALALSDRSQPGVYDITDRVKRMIRTVYKGDRAKAERACVERFIRATHHHPGMDPNEAQVLKEVALWAEATHQKDPAKLQLMERMIHTKPVDPYQYQALLLKYFE